jgi:uncharacterized protein YdhG (YjbR/CyaY superfamily)
MHADQLKTIDDYIFQFPEHIQKALQELRQCLKKAVPEGEEVFEHLPCIVFDGKVIVTFQVIQNQLLLHLMRSNFQPNRSDQTNALDAKGSLVFSFERSIPYDFIHKMIAARARKELVSKWAPK